MNGDVHGQLNELYRPLHEAEREALKFIRALGYRARFAKPWSARGSGSFPCCFASSGRR